MATAEVRAAAARASAAQSAEVRSTERGCVQSGAEDELPLRVAVIIGSTREGREGAGVAAWFTALARKRHGLALDVVDLADFHFPERLLAQPPPGIAEFTERLGAAEAFIVITPEYNRSFPASLKQAIDYGYDEWHAKPVGFVSYGSNSVGMHAVEQLRWVFTELHTVTVRDSVSFDLLRAHDPDGTGRSATAMLGQLAWWGHALRDARAARPYCA
ncbi:NADPH-dependent FMN reductase [Streptomyces iconiensis]|uniref:NAD(P)H-dependent oxidoreductase n=1 Tax=Streptomyces iconiensis TaxID=1384038 RepID=A0ABT6ZPR6_9ACTN|nr:NAD(P)H-dependent oxidoreductase [Streptomyces iconiensis]MDJ1131042.1 NAD(P)H-dependent oxidoreductase [Streptomyces iconiensis]